MPTQTTNYGLAKPGVEEFYDVEVQNTNMDKIDAELKESEKVANKGQPGGYPSLDGNGNIPADQLGNVSSPVKSVNNKTGDVKLTASDVGAEPMLSTDRKRKITFGTAEPTGGEDGDIYFQYE